MSAQEHLSPDQFKELSEVSMNYSRSKLKHKVTAVTPDGEEAGHLHWARQDHEGPSGPLAEHEVDEVQVAEPYRRQKLATHMWQAAQVIDPGISHSGEKTSDGHKWSKSVGGNNHWDEAF